MGDRESKIWSIMPISEAPFKGGRANPRNWRIVRRLVEKEPSQATPRVVEAAVVQQPRELSRDEMLRMPHVDFLRTVANGVKARVLALSESGDIPDGLIVENTPSLDNGHEYGLYLRELFKPGIEVIFTDDVEVESIRILTNPSYSDSVPKSLATESDIPTRRTQLSFLKNQLGVTFTEAAK